MTLIDHPMHPVACFISYCFEIARNSIKYHVFSSAAFDFIDIFGASVAANRFAIPMHTSFSKVPLPDISAEVGRVVSVGDDTSSVRVRESSLQTSPCGLCERCLCLRARASGEEGKVCKTS